LVVEWVIGQIVMSDFKFDDVEVALVDGDLGARESIRGVMQSNGFRKFNLGQDIPGLIGMIKSGTPDMVIMGGEFEGGGVSKFVRLLRHNEFKGNPFVPVIVVTWNPTPELVRELVDAGIDDLVPKPISANHLLKRTANIINNRQPFIVTTDYVGPDRRKDSERGSDIPLVEVPNTLRAKATGDKTAAIDAKNKVNQVLAEINVQKMERHAFQIAWLVEQSMGSLIMGSMDDKIVGYMNKMNLVSKDLSKRMVGTDYAHISELSESIIQVSKSILQNKSSPPAKDVKLLAPLSQALKNSFDPNMDQAAVASDIAAVVSAKSG
jgi:DNA-binding NarL/FixJ family response regulator